MRVLLAAAVVLAPALLTAGAGPASAAAGSLQVTTLGRNGARVAGSQFLAIDAATDVPYQGTSDHSLALANGHYTVLTDVWNSKDDTDTLAARSVTVSGATTVTIDARQGVSLNLSLDSSPGAGYAQTIYANLCAGPYAYDRLEAWNQGGHLYVIPNASKQLQLGYLSEWAGQDFYEASGVTTGLPTRPGGTFHRGLMSTVHVTDDRGPAGGTTADVAFQPHGSSCQSDLYHESLVSNTPYAVTGHLSAGTWDIRSAERAQNGATIGSYDSARVLAPGKSYWQAFYRPAWGPAHSLPYVLRGKTVFETDQMFQDPSTAGSEAASLVTSTLSRSGTVLARQTTTDWQTGPGVFSGRMTTSGWYSLDVYARRYHPGMTYPAGMLSPSSHATFHFYANPSAALIAPVFLTRFIPAGISSAGKAAPHSTTPVGLFLDRANPHLPDVGFHTDTAKSVLAWYSLNDGKTWHGLPVTHSGSSWSTAVPNPASGIVSLSAKVTDTAGNSAQTTVNRAYAVG
jgi:hypothetical protein